VNKKIVKIEPPKLFLNDLPVFKQLTIQSDDFFEMRMIEDCVIENQTAHKVTFEKIIFKNVTFTETILRGAEFTDVIFERCDLSNVDFTDAIIHRTKFNECKMIGINFASVTLRNVEMTSCIADYASFKLSNIKQTIIQDSSLRKTDFSNSKIQKFHLFSANIDQAQLSGTKLEGIDLSDCEFDGLGVTVEDLKGCIISREQTYIFAKLFGLIVNE